MSSLPGERVRPVAPSNEEIVVRFSHEHQRLMFDSLPIEPGQVDDGPEPWAVALALGIFFLVVAAAILIGSIRL